MTNINGWWPRSAAGRLAGLVAGPRCLALCFRCPGLGRAPGLRSALRCARLGVTVALGPLDHLDDQALRCRDVDPIPDLGPLALFEILVVLKELRDLLAQDCRQILVRPDAGIEGM